MRQPGIVLAPGADHSWLPLEAEWKASAASRISMIYTKAPNFVNRDSRNPLCAWPANKSVESH